eukprot:9474837-Alexandrium_andersonii.AAC.1
MQAVHIAAHGAPERSANVRAPVSGEASKRRQAAHIARARKPAMQPSRPGRAQSTPCHGDAQAI